MRLSDFKAHSFNDFQFQFWFLVDKPPPQDSQGPFLESPYTPFLSFCLSLSGYPHQDNLRALLRIPWPPWAFHHTNPLALVSVLTHEVVGTTGDMFSRQLCYLVMELGIVWGSPFSLIRSYRNLQALILGLFPGFSLSSFPTPTLPPHSTLVAWKQYRPFLSYFYSSTWAFLLVMICLFWTWN